MTSGVDEHSNLKLQLATEVLRSVGEARLAVAGGSMLPSLYPDDILEIHRVKAENISRDDIVVFACEGRLVVHRVLHLNREQDKVVLITRGDRVAKADAPVSADQLLGRVQAIQRGHRNLVPRMSVWTRMASWVLCRSEFCTRVLIRLAMLRSNAVRRNSHTPETAWAS